MVGVGYTGESTSSTQGGNCPWFTIMGYVLGFCFLPQSNIIKLKTNENNYARSAQR